MARGRLWHSLLVRLLVASSLVALVSVATTAWLAAQSASRSIRQELGAALAGDARTYEALLTYAVGHPSWAGVQPAVDDLARRTGRRIVLTTENRRLLADSHGRGEVGTPARPSAVLDPLAVDVALVPDAAPDRIDPRVAGPFRLPPAERARLAAAARTFLGCRSGVATGPVRTGVTGRPLVDPGAASPAGPVPAPAAPAECATARQVLVSPTPTEQAALRQLTVLVNGCLAERDMPALQLTLGPAARPGIAPGPAAGPADAAAVSGCLEAGRRAQLRPYVTPPALLFVAEPGADVAAAPGSLASVGTSRIVLVAGVILLLTVGVSVALAVLLVRPLRAVTGAARRMRYGELGARAAVRSRGELGELAQAFNEMAAHRERTEQQRRAMVSDISHELRTPLGTMRSWLEAARDGVVELDDARLSSLLGEALVLQHLIEDLQDLALVEAGELRLHREVVDVGDLLDQVAAAHRDGAAGLALHPAAEGVVEVSADPVRLRQVVTNLVTNAVRHTPAGGTVRLSARRVDGEVEIEVADTGVGIDAADLPQVFDRFWRADRSRTRGTGGSGLGLAIVHGLVTAHGGSVDVTSTRGEGTTFTVRLPR